MSHIEHVVRVFTRLHGELFLLDHLIDILVSENYFKFKCDYRTIDI